jgi:hypothetical protein
MSEYKREKANGNKNTTTLVLGIVATALGGAAIMVGAIYSIIGLILVSFAY